MRDAERGAAIHTPMPSARSHAGSQKSGCRTAADPTAHAGACSHASAQTSRGRRLRHVVIRPSQRACGNQPARPRGGRRRRSSPLDGRGDLRAGAWAPPPARALPTTCRRRRARPINGAPSIDAATFEGAPPQRRASRVDASRAPRSLSRAADSLSRRRRRSRDGDSARARRRPISRARRRRAGSGGVRASHRSTPVAARWRRRHALSVSAHDTPSRRRAARRSDELVRVRDVARPRRRAAEAVAHAPRAGAAVSPRATARPRGSTAKGHGSLENDLP